MSFLALMLNSEEQSSASLIMLTSPLNEARCREVFPHVSM